MKTIVFALILLGAAYQDVECVIHDWATCWSVGETKVMGGHVFTKYNCSCGDSVWVRND